MLSIAETLRNFRFAIAIPVNANNGYAELRHAVTDPYVRKDKTSRDYPRKKQESPAGAPQIVAANKSQIQQAKQIAAIDKQKG